MKHNRQYLAVTAVFALTAVCFFPSFANYEGALHHEPTQAELSEQRHAAYEEAKAAGEVGFDVKHADKSSTVADGVLTALWSGEVVNRETAGQVIFTLDGFDETEFTPDELDDTEVRVRVVHAQNRTSVWNGSLRDFAANYKLADEMRSGFDAYVRGGETVTWDVRITTPPTTQPYTPMTELPNLDVAVHHLY